MALASHFLGIPACDLDDPASYKGADVIIVGAHQ